MAVGQGALVTEHAELRAVEDRLEAAERTRGASHAAQLSDVLELHALHTRAGMGLSTVPVVALVLRCSEARAGSLLDQALGLGELPDGLEALRSGLLTVEQSAVVVAQLAVLSPPERVRVWQRLLARLRQDLDDAVVCPPARLAEVLRRWVVQADPDGAAARRRAAHSRRAVSYRRHDDGLADLFLTGLAGPVAQACLARIREHSAPVGSADERTADQRRLDAAADLILGRHPLPLSSAPADAGAGAAAGVPGCGCRIGAAVPCGAQVVVHVPWGAALGTTDELAEVAGHGPLEPDLLAELLLAAPVLRAVHVDADGVPVAVDDSCLRPPRGDAAAAVRAALTALAAAPPGELHPRHPLDHRARHRATAR